MDEGGAWHVCLGLGHLRPPRSTASGKSLYSGLRPEQGPSCWASGPQFGGNCPVRTEGRKEGRGGGRIFPNDGISGTYLIKVLVRKYR